MLTLGLMEGVLSATLGLLVLVGLANGNAPLHRLLGPPLMAVVGLVAYLIHDSGRVGSPGEAAGLAFFAFVVFFLPLTVMRFAWKLGKARPASSGEDAPSRTAAGRIDSNEAETKTERRAA